MSQMKPMKESGINFVLLLMNTDPMVNCHNLQYIQKGMQLISISDPLLPMISASTLCKSLYGMHGTEKMQLQIWHFWLDEAAHAADQEMCQQGLSMDKK